MRPTFKSVSGEGLGCLALDAPETGEKNLSEMVGLLLGWAEKRGLCESGIIPAAGAGGEGHCWLL